jgi:hypothetical protein
MKNRNVKSVVLLASLIALVFGANLVTGCDGKHGDSETDCFSQGYLAGLILLNPNNPNNQ